VGGADVTVPPGVRQLASPRQASSSRLTRSVRSPLPITQQAAATTITANSTKPDRVLLWSDVGVLGNADGTPI
jgi:hypothetical protein